MWTISINTPTKLSRDASEARNDSKHASKDPKSQNIQIVDTSNYKQYGTSDFSESSNHPNGEYMTFHTLLKHIHIYYIKRAGLAKYACTKNECSH